MAYTFGDYPEIAFALPFENLSFERWDDTLPDQWEYHEVTPTGSHDKYNPGFDSTRAIKISDTGVITSADNTLVQSIDLPSYIENNQIIRAGACILSDLGGVYGAGIGVLKITQNAYGYQPVSTSSENSASWALIRADSTNPLLTAYSDLHIYIETRSYNSEADPACLFDCFFAEYGRSVAERYYTFPRKPEFQGLNPYPMTFSQNERTGRGKRRTWDPTGGAVKWTIEMPFQNIPGAMVDALYQFYRRNKGLDDAEGVHLVLHHKLIDTSDSYSLRMPPWLICDIANDDFPFRYSGGYLGAKLFSGTLIFEEV